MRHYVHGLLGQAVRKNSRQLAERAGHRTPDGFQRLLNSGVWDADALRDAVRSYVGHSLGPGDVLIIDGTGFVKKGTTSAGVGRQYTGTSGKIDKPDRRVRRLRHQFGPVHDRPGALPTGLRHRRLMPSC
ncbi:transposase [Streptomyces griseoloalbus]|uniref:Transposase n=1 Tax=Streptomyces griseoloalbus TaxID=67303 RepID=A0ABV3E3Y8_9ACTN